MCTRARPSAVTAFMSVGAKAAGFAALLRVFVTAFPSLSADLTPVLWALSALTMILGNVVAIAQTQYQAPAGLFQHRPRRLYLDGAGALWADATSPPDSVASALFYLVAYAFTSFGAWAVVIALEKAEGKGLELDDYAGLGRKISRCWRRP